MNLILLKQLNRKHEMFLNFSFFELYRYRFLLNRKHEMFLNLIKSANNFFVLLLNRKHEMFLNLDTLIINDGL